MDRAGGISAERRTCVVSKMQVKYPQNHGVADFACTRAGGYPRQAAPGALVAARGFGGAHGEFLDDMCTVPILFSTAQLILCVWLADCSSVN